MAEASEFLDGAFLRRIVLPGILSALYIHPYLKASLLPITHKQYGLEEGIILLAEAVFFGLLMSSAVLPIFQIYEGFRWTWLTKWARQRNTKLLKEHVKELKSLSEGTSEEKKNRARMLLADLSDFPVEPANGKGKYLVERPTRLGNIIACYELYPKTRYGVDGLAFWYHLLILAPESARKSYEEKVVFAEGMVLASASGAIVTTAALLSLLGRAVGMMSGYGLISLHLPARVDVIGCLSGTAAWVIFYKLSLPAHRQVRASFQALTDLAMPKLVRYIKSYDMTRAGSAESEKVKEYIKYLHRRTSPDAPVILVPSTTTTNAE